MEEVKKMIDQHDAEVRAKAIDEFAKSLNERLEDLYQPCYLCREDRCAIDRAIEIVNQLSEQLKEGGKDGK